jgi:hypothetical protein
MKKQKINQIKFRAQYLYLVSELIDNAFFVKTEFKNVCFIDNGIFSKKVIKVLKAQFQNIDIISIKSLKDLSAKKYDLVLAPLSLQFFTNLKYNFSLLQDSLKEGGIILASGFNVLSSADSILELKHHLLKENLRPSLISFFDLGDIVNKLGFKDKSLDRENILILGNNIEFINLFCLKKPQISENKPLKVLIN